MIFKQESHLFNVDFRLTMISGWQRNTVADKLALFYSGDIIPCYLHQNE